MKKAIAWLPSLLWMGLIFAMSAAPGDVSAAQSGAVLEWLLALLGRIFPAAASIPPDALHLLIRKGAHMAEYAALALFNLRALRANGARRPAAAALLLASAYAATDEFHQGFVAGRGPSLIDVMIDAAGALLAPALERAYARLRRHK